MKQEETVVTKKEGSSTTKKEPKASLTPLYLARSLAAWGDRTWQFVGGMFMLRFALFSDPALTLSLRLGDHHDNVHNAGDFSLQLVGIYGLVSCLAVLVSGSAIGRIVDNTARNRWRQQTR